MLRGQDAIKERGLLLDFKTLWSSIIIYIKLKAK